MCFYNDDYDWYAEVNEIRHERTDTPEKCFECSRPIQPGEWRQSIHQREHECRQFCEDEDSDSFDESINPTECEHNCGESFDCSICRECSLLLEAIWDVERIEGCPEHSRQPCYGELYDALNPRQDGEKYRRHALEKYPGLIASRMFQA